MLDSNLLWNIIICISTIIDWIFLKVCLEKFSEKKKENLNINISSILNIILVIFLNSIDINYNIKILVVIIGIFLFYIYNYETTPLKALTLILICWMGLVGLEIISLNVTLMINPGITINQLFKKNIFRLELIYINNMLLLLILPIVKSLKYDEKLDRIQFLYLIIPIIANLLSLVLIITLLLQGKSKLSLQKISLLIVSIMLFLSNISWIKIISDMAKSIKIELENELMREKIDIQYKWYLDIQEKQLKVRKLYHDINNHILCINELNKSNDIANKYISNIKNELNCLEPEISTNNMILDIIVNEKSKMCKINNICFDVDINFSKCRFIDIIDICSIFSNIIDNAIEACIKIDSSKNRFIRLKGTIVNKFFVLKCENSKINEIKIKKNKIKTDKKNSFLHGVGINSIKSSVQKYDGEVYIDFSADKFKIQIYIPLI